MKEYELTDNEREELSIFRLAKDKTTVSSKDIVLATEKAAQGKMLGYLRKNGLPYLTESKGVNPTAKPEGWLIFQSTWQSLLKDFRIS